jgi:hypothetical protein
VKSFGPKTRNRENRLQMDWWAKMRFGPSRKFRKVFTILVQRIGIRIKIFKIFQNGTKSHQLFGDFSNLDFSKLV